MVTEDRWFVRFRGHTLGPLSTEQVRVSLRKKELGADDRVASAKDPSWKRVADLDEFRAFLPETASPLTALVPPPSPRSLWKKKRAPLPAVPVQELKTEEPSSASAPEKAKPKAAKAKPKKTKKAAPAAPPAEIPRPEPVRSVPTTAAANTTAERAPADLPLPAEALSLVEVLRDWKKKEEDLPEALRFARPDLAPAPVFAPRPEAEPAPEAWMKPAPAPRGTFELKLVASKQFVMISAALALLLLAAIGIGLQKMRGPGDFRLPDPSSPTIQPSAQDDPVPALKAPTRPQRD